MLPLQQNVHSPYFRYHLGWLKDCATNIMSFLTLKKMYSIFCSRLGPGFSFHLHSLVCYIIATLWLTVSTSFYFFRWGWPKSHKLCRHTTGFSGLYHSSRGTEYKSWRWDLYVEVLKNVFWGELCIRFSFVITQGFR